MRSTIWPLAVIVGVLVSLSVGQDPPRSRPSDRDIEGLRGSVKRLEERTTYIEVKGGRETEVPAEISVSKTFDEKGRLILRSYTGTAAVETKYSYDKDGNRRGVNDRRAPFERPNEPNLPDLSLTAIKYDPAEHSVFERRINTRDPRGPVIEFSQKHDATKYVFDGANRLVRKSYFTVDDQEIYVEEYYYKDKDHPTDMVSTNRGSVLQTMKYSYEFDHMGNWIKRRALVRTLQPQRPDRTETTYRKISYYR